MIAIATVMFFCTWFLMFFYQFRSPKKHTGIIDMKEYVFCSNLIFSFPNILIKVLFFNSRLTKLPIPIVCYQIVNIVMYTIFIISIYIFDISVDTQFLELKIWFGIFIFILLSMVVDHEIYCLRKRNKWLSGRQGDGSKPLKKSDF